MGWNCLLLLAVVCLLPMAETAWATENLARNKTTEQWPPFQNRQPGLAVNGIYSDFTQTHPRKTSPHKWWRVDLGHIYNIAKIKLYNRRSCCGERLAKITIFTSAATTPTNLTSSFDGWTNRSYRDYQYPSLGVIDFKPSVLARHVAVYSENTEVLSLAEVEVYATANLAHNKPVIQSTTLSTWSANLAVNGIYDADELSQTHSSPVEWWKVDLQKKYRIGRIELYTREGFSERLSQITVMTSNAVTPTDLSVSHEGWTNRSYQGFPYGAVGVIDFTSPIEAQHVAVVSENMAARLTLVEVVVYECNHVSGRSAIQSSLSGGHNASKAIDGDLSTWSATTSGGGAHWWKVDLGERIIFTTAVVYVRNGRCESRRAGCSASLSDFYFLTNKDTTTESPNTSGHGGWNICYHNSTATGNSYNRGCNRNTPTPPTRLFSIYKSRGGAVMLREVEIYGDALPQLANDIEARTDRSQYRQVTVSFNRWNQLMPGTTPPTQYIVSRDSTETVRHADHSSGRVTLTLNGLEQGRTYTLTVKCQIEGVDCPGPQPTFTASTQACSAPDKPVLSLDKTESTNNGRQRWLYTANWTKSEANCYGPLGYRYRVNGQPQKQMLLTQTTFHLDGFEIFTFKLWAINPVGLSSEEAFHRNRSPQLRPQFGSSTMSISSTSPNCVNLTWTQPQYPGGLINNYKVKCGEKNEKPFSNSTTSTRSCNHPPYTNITCTLIASNDAGDSTPLNETEVTQCDDPSSPEFDVSSFVYNEISAGIQVNLQQSEPNCRTITNYFVRIRSPTKDVRDINMSTHGVFNITDLQVSTTYIVNVTTTNNMNLRSHAEKTLTTPDIYVPGIPKFNLSDNGSCIFLTIISPSEPSGIITHYQVECNKITKVIDASRGERNFIEICGFPSNTEVTCSVSANNSLGFGEETSNSVFLGIRQLTTPRGSQLPVNVIAGTVGGVLVLALACFIALFFYRKRRSQVPKSNADNFQGVQMEGAASVPLTALKPPIAKPRAEPVLDNGEEEENQYGNAGNVSIRRSEPIPVEKLHWYNSTNTAAIMVQYDQLEKLPKPNMSEALLPENKGKCRYKNLYPANRHRVKLVREGDGTDFINASYMRGYFREKQYIAAQGPFTDEVVEDFWLMIWQQQPSAIVMVTKAVEYNKMKCLQYWPLKVGSASSYGDINVTLKSSESWSDYVANQFTVTKDGERRTIPHFSYSGWPDHGVPDLEIFITFHRLINSTIGKKGKKPLMLHCSAGVGRTGTYIALDYLIDQAKNEGCVDMFECVREMRSRRPCMLQTDEQYIFLHHVLYESLATDGFVCPSNSLDSKINHHYKKPGSKSDLITQEYQHIAERIQSVEFSYTLGREPNNTEKNRFSEILPSDLYMPFLSKGRQGNYINAVFVDGYRDKKQWVATQLPLTQTVRDFWQLVLEQDIKIIVQLESSQKPFYPMKDSGSLTSGDLVIKRISSADSDKVKTITVDMEHPQGNSTIKVLVVKEWPADALPATDLIISVHTAVERLQQKTSSATICVTCLDGSSKCGLYICAHNAIEKIKVEQQVDLYNPTVLAKLRRPQFIPTIEQYRHLYLMAKDYLSSFSEYANFN